MSSKLQLDVRHLNRWWRHLVDAYEVRQAWWLLQVKLCDPCLSTLKWCSSCKALYQCSALPFFITLTLWFCKVIRFSIYDETTWKSAAKFNYIFQLCGKMPCENIMQLVYGRRQLMICIHRLTHIYLDTVPHTDVVWNYVATYKLTTQDGCRFPGSNN